MKLELGFIQIKDIQFSKECKVENGTLFVNADEVKAFIFQDDDVTACVKAANFDIAKPGESIRITPVKDVIEPRVKVEGPGGEFPGVIAKVETVGSGKTHVLRGMAVVTAGKIVGFQEGIIDMSGEGAKFTPFSKLNNLVLVCEPVEGVRQHEYEHAVRLAGLRAATFIGELARNVKPDETKSFETFGIKEGIEKFPTLPRVAYVHMLQSQGLLHDTYVYGVDAKRSLTTIINPTETMDGAIISGNCVSACDKNTTYHHQNNPVVADMFEQHGKTLNYVCNIITNENVYLADKQRSSDWTAKLCRLLDLDGVIVSQEGFGNPDTDLIMNTKKIEMMGVKTTIITDEYAGQDGKSQSLADADPLADACVTGGNANEVILLPKMDKVIGTLDYVDKIAGGHAGSLRPDGTIEAELQVITGATNEMGFNCLSAR
ncbi:MAG: glycine/sarcosine/betaine reductase component B subunit [Oscillospiraceae bacterium]